MDLEILQIISRIGTLALGGSAALLAIWTGARLIRRTARRLCPGPRQPRWRWALPSRWFFSRPCGYDLSGLPQGANGTVVCPECGRDVAPGAARRHACRTHPGRLLVVVLLMIGMVRAGPIAKQSSWHRHVPTTALILMKRALGTEIMPTRLRRELDERLYAGQLTDTQIAWVIPALAADLRNDREPRNASRARWQLKDLGVVARPQLERSLLSDCPQERELAAETLRSLLIAPEPEFKWPTHLRLVGVPSDDLLRVTVENLDGWCNWPKALEYLGDPYVFLAHFPERAAPLARAGLESDDPSQQLRCAGLAVVLRASELLPRAVEILIGHLADNEEYRDARYAAGALRSMGPDAEEPLLPYLYASDPQKRALTRLVFQHLRKSAPEDEDAFDAALYRLTAGGSLPNESP